MDERFHQAMAEGSVLDEAALALGAPMQAAVVAPEVGVRLALSMAVRHGKR